MMSIGCRTVVTYVTVRYDRKDVEFFGIIRDKVVFTVKKSKKWEEVFQYLRTNENNVYMKEIVSYIR
jgi:hypothetical protein